jgi:hypothetical protein
MNIDNTQANEGKKYGTAYLTFMNLKGSAYKKGNLIVEQTLASESKNSPLCKLAEFTDMIVEDCGLNESKNGMNISVCVNAVGKENMNKLYEWLKKYTDETKISEIAPGLLESLGIAKPEEQKVDEEASVASRFSKYRKLYESDDDDTEDDKKDEDPKDGDEEGDKKEDDSAGESKKEDDGEDPESDEEEELTAVIIEVKKGDEEAAKQEMIDAGVDEDDIEILEPEEKDDEGDEGDNGDNTNKPENESEDDDKEDGDSEETVKIKVAIDSFDALKEYLEGKGFNLEEELGGEIVTDDEDDDEGDEEDGKEKEELEGTFDGFDDLFGDMGDESGDEEKK